MRQHAVAHPGWPRFRVGIDTGSAVVGNVGSHTQRSFTAIGDTTNLAARVQAVAEPGQVVVSAATRELLPAAEVVPLGPTAVKGKREPVELFALRDIGSG